MSASGLGQNFLELFLEQECYNMLEIVGEVFILAAAIFVGSVAFDWWRNRRRY